MDFVIESNVSFNVIRKQSLRTLLELTYGRKIIIPTTRYFMKTIDDRFKEMKAKLIELLEKQKYICITCDVWSSRAQSFIGFTVHYLELYERKSFALAFRQLEKRQTYKVLGKIIADVLREFGIPVNKVRHIVTDGGSGFCKSFKVYCRNQDVIVEEIVENAEIDQNTENGDEVENESTESIPIFMQNEDGEVFVSNELNFNSEHLDEPQLSDDIENIDEFESDEITHDDSNEIGTINEDNIADSDSNIELPPQRRCTSHVLNLFSNDFEKMLPSAAQNTLVGAVNKLHALWTFTHRSAQARSIVQEVLGCILLIPVVTRWNSKFDAIAKTCRDDIRPKINFLIQRLTSEIKGASHLRAITNNDWNILLKYLETMKFVAMSLDRLQGEDNASQGLILPTLIALKFHASALEANGPTHAAFKKTLLDIIKKRFDRYFEFTETNRELVLASVSIPQFKTNFIEDACDERRAKDMLRDECVRLTNEVAQLAETNQPNSSTENDTFFVTFSHTNTRRNSIESDIDSEIARYLSDSRNNIEILDEYPNIRNVYINTTLHCHRLTDKIKK